MSTAAGRSAKANMAAEPVNVLAAGIDLGGTFVKYVLADSNGQMRFHKQVVFDPSLKLDWFRVIESLVAESRALALCHELRIGVSAPGLAAKDARSIAFMPGRLEGLEGLDWTARLNATSPIPVLNDAQNILRAIFNFVRASLEEADAKESPGAKLARKLAGSPSSLARRPIIEMARATLDGRIKSRYIALPSATTKNERDKLVSALEARAETPEQFVGGIDFVYDATSDDGIAVYDAVTGRLRINGLHPFVGAFFDEFTSKASGLPLEVFAMAEV